MESNVTQTNLRKKATEAYGLAHKVNKLFHKQYDTVLCRELIGYDLSKPEELEEAWKAKVFEKRRVNFVKATVEIVVDLSEC